MVLYPFTGAQFDELTSEIGDKILLKREVDEQWIYGTFRKFMNISVERENKIYDLT